MASRDRSELDPVPVPLLRFADAVAVGVIVVGREGSVELVNRVALEILGASRDELDPDDVAAILSVASRAPTGAERIALERHDGRRLLVELSATPLGERDRALSVVVTMQDVTDRERRERADREFVTNAAHELQTPIAAIASAVEVLQSGAKDRLEDRDRFLQHVERAVDRLGRLTRALLVLARAQTRAETPRREVLEVEPLLRAIADGLPGGDVRVDCAPDVAVIANRYLLEQAVVNLGENAARHARRGVVLAARSDAGRTTIEVRDSGPGIPEADREGLFSGFLRGTAPGSGPGLGLAIVREVVDALDGELGLDTSPNGTRVSIVLPGATVRTT